MDGNCKTALLAAACLALVYLSGCGGANNKDRDLQRAADRGPAKDSSTEPPAEMDKGKDNAFSNSDKSHAKDRGSEENKDKGPIATPLDEPEVQKDYHEVKVFYATGRQPETLSLLACYLATLVVGAIAAVALLLTATGLMRRWNKPVVGLLLLACIGCGIGSVTLAQRAAIEAQAIRRADLYHNRRYGGKRHEVNGEDVLEYGTCVVTIPTIHKIGQIERPKVYRLEFAEDPKKHVILTHVTQLDQETFFETLAARVQAAGDESSRNEGSADAGKQILVFIHGFNVRFDDAARRAAQLADDLKFCGTPVLFSWPSVGLASSYPVDEDNVRWASYQLQEFLGQLAKRSGASSIHIIAHSMGNRALVQALSELTEEPPKQFGEVVMAAPDIDAHEVRKNLGKLLAAAQRVTLYSSSRDKALLASRKLHGNTRAGLAGDYLVVVPGMDTIDASSVDTDWLSHSYYGNTPLLVEDLKSLLQHTPAAGRTWLDEHPFQDKLKYWNVRPDLLEKQAHGE